MSATDPVQAVAEVLAQALAAADGWKPEAHDPMMRGRRGYAMWERYVEPAERILADPGPLLAALAEAGVLTEDRFKEGYESARSFYTRKIRALTAENEEMRRALDAARPAIEREAKAALIEEVKRLQDQIARARMEPGQDRQKAMHGYAERAEQALAERDALAARLAAVEALSDEWEQAARQGNNEWSACLLAAVPELRAALATGTEGQA